MSSEVETSLNISEMVRDSSTSVGMTKKMRERTCTIRRAFTIIELLVVISIIVILAGLILSTVGYVQKKGARARAEAEIAAMSAALESYRADNGIYPRDSNTDALTAVTDQTYSTKNPPDPVPTSYDADPRQSSGGPNAYKAASFTLYGQLSGNLNGDRSTIT